VKSGDTVAWKASTGTKFSQRVNLLIASLGVHYHGHEDVKAKLTPQAKAWLAKNCTSTDNPRAFEEFAVGLHDYLPKKYEPDEMRLVLF
jgi:hypothetical protein